MFEDLLDVTLSLFVEKGSWIVGKSELQLTPGDFRPAIYVAGHFFRGPLLATAGYAHRNVVGPRWEVFRGAPRFLQVWAVLALVCFAGGSFGVSGMETAGKLLSGAMLALLAILCASLEVKRGAVYSQLSVKQFTRITPNGTGQYTYGINLENGVSHNTSDG